MTKLPFQEKAVAALIEKFKRLWNAPGTMLPLVFKSPTGSGKTFMTESFIQELKSSGGFHEDVAWIWITFADDLAMQSKEKFEEYFSTGVGRRLLTVADFADGVLKRDDILFLNWQKLVANDANARILRRPDDPAKKKESGYYYEDVIEATHNEGRTVIMVIDESHKNVSQLATEKVINPANPKVILKVSATPTDIPSTEDIDDAKAEFYRVKREDVVKEGLIKEAVVSQTKEEIESGSEEDDLDAKLLDLAIKKRNVLRAEWAKAGSKVNPLILIQLPDEKTSQCDGAKIKKDVVIDYLKKNGTGEEKITNWFSGDVERDKLKFIAENDSPIEFLLFKQAAGTGWDCPRAQILVMYRDIKSPVFKTQTLGRIIRNPEPGMDLNDYPMLRKGYLYTNYTSSEVKDGDKGQQDNPILMRKASLAIPIPNGGDTMPIHGAMKTDFVSRADYGDLGKASEFQECFYSSMDKWFGIGDSDFGAARSARLEAKGVSLVQSFKNTIAVDVTFKSADGEKDGGADIDDEMSANDVERNFDAKCLELLAAQTDDESKVGNLARSEGMFRTAMRAWLREALPDIPETGRYKIFLTDAAKAKDGASKFLSAVTATLKEYAPIRKKNVESRKKKAEAIPSVTFLLKSSYEYSAACEIYRNAEGVEPNLSVVKPLYLLPAYNGRENETAFIEFLESQTDKIEWWFKNGSEGKDAFGLKYFNTTYQEDRLFYPDWIVKFKDGRIGIFDTKAGATAVNPEGREMGLRNKIAAMNKAAGRALFFGGLVVRENGLWHYHEGKDYSYTPGGMGAGWKQLWF